MKDYKNYYLIPAAPEIVYQALTVPATIELWSGHPAVMSMEPGSAFSLFGGDIAGKNVAFEPNHKIVQQWYFINVHKNHKYLDGKILRLIFFLITFPFGLYVY
jgi:uncharacterized protein YndB with AHSA1/START domain